MQVSSWLKSSEKSSEIRPRYEVENLLQGILNNAKDNILFESGNAKIELITVSNIHRAKGREFDSVILIDEVLNAENILEQKICYVALTRAKEVINLAEMPTQYYIIGKLYPQNNSVNIFDEMQNPVLENDNSDYDAPISLSNQFTPSSMAVTFILKENVLAFKISGSYAFYKPEKVSDKKILWQRDPYFFTEIFSFDKNIFNLEGGLQLQIYNQSYAGSNGKIVTVALVNTNFGGEKFSC